MTDQRRTERNAYLEQRPTLLVRVDDRIEEAPLEDQEVAKGYAEWKDKGATERGMRLTIMTRSKTYRVGEEVRIIHVLDAPEPGVELYVMGPKSVFGEYLDGQLATEPQPDVEDPWVPTDYDGATVPSPAADFNYDITTYRFDRAGQHHFEWRLGVLRSNLLSIEIVD